jgi:hypothetical protein
MNPFQAMVDGLGAAWQQERARKQLTLGRLIEQLFTLDPARRMEGVGNPHSYRGYYCDLAFELLLEPYTTVGQFHAAATGAMGQVFVGYKGGDFVMGAKTPLWIASYGNTGDRLIGLDTNGEVVRLITAPDDEL